MTFRTSLFRTTSSELVVLPVIVTDRKNRLVTDLPRDRFGVYTQILNAFNASTITSTQNRVPSVTIAGLASPVLYGAPGTIFVGRQVNIGARWSF